MSEKVDAAILRAASEVLDVAPERLSPQSRFSQLKAGPHDRTLILERAALEVGVNLHPIFETMPYYSVRFNGITMASLRWLSGISPSAKHLLARSTLQPVDDTLGSMAASLQQGRYVDSGLRCAPMHPPNSPWRSLRWALVPLAIVVILLAVTTVHTMVFVMPEGTQPLPWWFFYGRMVGVAWVYQTRIELFLAIWYGHLIVPGLIALYRESRKAAQRRSM